jgi:D-serine deaminase-like pyridoxal phosphate-dependent protein
MPAVLIEIDCDGHRGGLLPDDRMLATIADILRAGGVTLRGVLTHAGESYGCRNGEGIPEAAEQERAAAVAAARLLREAGHPCPVVSVGSTPTAHFATNLDGVTEVRAGVFMFFDLVMHGIGVCSLDDIALSVVATVIGHRPEKGWILIDGGWMAMSRDRGTARTRSIRAMAWCATSTGRPGPT